MLSVFSAIFEAKKIVDMLFSKSVYADGLFTAVNGDRHPKYHGRDKLYNKKVISINTWSIKVRFLDEKVQFQAYSKS